jgi:hydroxyacyl-ACP dehydratase HTD2-like protein with hotdog domain
MANLLTPDLKRAIGKRSAPITELVTAREIRRYATATSQRQEKYLSGREAPPLFYARFLKEIPTLDRMIHDGRFMDDLLPPLPLKRTMAGGCETTYHRPIRAGDTLTGVFTIRELYEKEGSSGPLIFAVVELAVTDAENRPVVTELTTRIFR